MGHHHQIFRTVSPEMESRALPLPFIDKGVNPKNNDCRLYSSQYGDSLLFPSLFALSRMIIIFSIPTYQVDGCLHTALFLMRSQNPHPHGLSIWKIKLQYGRGCRMAQAIWDVERGGLDLISLMKSIRTEV